MLFLTLKFQIEKIDDYFEVVINDSEKIKVKNIINAAGLGAVDIAKSIVGINLKKYLIITLIKGIIFTLNIRQRKYLVI